MALSERTRSWFAGARLCTSDGSDHTSYRHGFSSVHTRHVFGLGSETFAHVEFPEIALPFVTGVQGCGQSLFAASTTSLCRPTIIAPPKDEAPKSAPPSSPVELPSCAPGLASTSGTPSARGSAPPAVTNAHTSLPSTG